MIMKEKKDMIYYNERQKNIIHLLIQKSYWLFIKLPLMLLYLHKIGVMYDAYTENKKGVVTYETPFISKEKWSDSFSWLTEIGIKS
jgi:hypothetical protein